MLNKQINSINVSIILQIDEHYVIESLYLCACNKFRQTKWKN